jgi:outer membrane protein assembly factor BamB
MKLILNVLLLTLLLSCSFDNRSGIWKNINEADLDVDERFKDFESLYTQQKSFNEIKESSNNFEPKLEKVVENLKWRDEFYQASNKYDNFSYRNINAVIFKSKKLSKHVVNKKILFDGDNVISTDVKGNITIYSVNSQKIFFKFNFYKKKLKKIKKSLNIILEDNIIYVTDNLGYLYSISYKEKKILWAQNYKKPLRSNLKIYKNKLFFSDQDNLMYIVNKLNGEKIKILPTEEVTLKNNFINSLTIDKDQLFYLNNFGSLYSISPVTNTLNWFINLNQSLDLNTSNLFYSNPLVLSKDHIFIATDPYLYIVGKKNGSTLIKKNITSVVTPIVSANNLFLITKNNLLVSMNTKSGKINFSVDISQKIANFLKTKNKKSINVKSLSLVNNRLFIFLKNSYVVQFNANGKILQIEKLPVKLNTDPIFINNSILYLDNKNRLAIVD